MLVIGAGGLGCPAIRHLAAAGVSRLGVAEFDTVEVSNLPRQILYSENDLGRPKLDVVRERLEALPGRSAFALDLHAGIVRGDEDWLGDYEVIIDAVDTAAQKLALHDAIVRRHIPFVHAGASGWEAQLLTIRQSGCLRCFFGGMSGEEHAEAPDCRRAGILGPVVGLAGVMAAGEALRLLGGRSGRYERLFWSMDARAGRTRTVPFEADKDCAVCGAAPESP